MASPRWRKLLWGSDLRETGQRLSLEIALAPMVVFFWIQSHGWYNWSTRHPAEALYACREEALIAWCVTSGISVGLALLSGKTLVEKVGLALLNSFCCYLVWSYLNANAVAYA